MCLFKRIKFGEEKIKPSNLTRYSIFIWLEWVLLLGKQAGVVKTLHLMQSWRNFSTIWGAVFRLNGKIFDP